MLTTALVKAALLAAVLCAPAARSAHGRRIENEDFQKIAKQGQMRCTVEGFTHSVQDEKCQREHRVELIFSRGEMRGSKKLSGSLLPSMEPDQTNATCSIDIAAFANISLGTESHTSQRSLASKNPHSYRHSFYRKLYSPFDWTLPQYYKAVHTATVGKSIFYINRTPEGLLLSEFDTITKAWVMMTEYPVMTDAEGWTQEQRYATIRVVVAEGSVYIFSRGEMLTYLVSYEPAASEWRTLPWHSFLQESEGYSLPQHYRTVQMVAVGSSLYITARSASGIVIASFNTVTQEWTNLPSLQEFIDDAVWTLPKYYLTFRSVTFQSYLWLYVRGPLGVNLIEFDTQTSQWGHSVLQYSYFTDAQGVTDASYYETAHVMAISTGIYISSRVPLGIDTVYFDPSTRTFALAKLMTMCTTGGGWTAPEYYETIQMMTCGETAHALARGYSNLHQASLQSPSSPWVVSASFTAYSNSQGWGVPDRYFTFRGVCVGSDIYAIGREGDQLKTMSTTPPSANWQSEVNLYGFCSAPCRTCDASGVDRCLACAGSAYLVGSFPSHCEPCHRTCRSCSDKLPTDCIRCWEHATRQHDGSCLCDGGYFLNQLGRCDTCDRSCRSCVGSGEHMCASCLEHSVLLTSAPSACVCTTGFYQNAETLFCTKCSKFCVSCTSPSECTECSQNSQLKGTSCECSPGFYESIDSQQCKQCSAGCWECVSTECLRCQSTWILFSGECIQRCPAGFYYINGACEPEPPIPSLLVYLNNTVECSFSKELTKNLENGDISINVRNDADFDVEWSISPKSKFQIFHIDLEYAADRPTEISALHLMFLQPSELHDSNGTAITTTELTGTLNPYPVAASRPSEQAAVFAAASHAVIASAVVASLLSANPSTLFSMLNQLQLITYIPMMNIDLPTEFADTLKGLSISGFAVNPFKEIYKDTDIPDFAKRYGFNSALFLVNSGLICIGFVLLFCSFCIVWCLAKVTETHTMAKYFQEAFKNYKWGYFLRFWIQSYLDFGISALLHFYAFPRSVDGVIENSIVAGCVLLCFFLSPIMLVCFIARNKMFFLHRNSTAFNESWGILFLEFTQSKRISSLAYFPSYIIRRCLYGSALVLFSSTPTFQSLLSVTTSAAVSTPQILCHLTLFRPHRSHLSQATEVLSEAATLATFSISASYLVVARKSAAGGVLSKLGRALIIGSIGGHFVLSIWGLMVVVGKLMQQFRNVLASSKQQKKKIELVHIN